MRARRTVYIVIFVVASLVAAGAYYLAQPRVELVRATADIPVLTQITADMVELVRVSPLDAPTDSARTLDAVVGQYAGAADPRRAGCRCPRGRDDPGIARVRIRCAAGAR